jgi:hypothetical protein
MDGPGWKKGDVFDYLDYYRIDGKSEPWVSPASKTYPAFPLSVMPAFTRYFEEIKPRTIQIYEVDVTDGPVSVSFCREGAADPDPMTPLFPVRVEVRE